MSYLLTDSQYGATVHSLSCSLAPANAYTVEGYEIPANAEPCGKCNPVWSDNE